MWPKIRRSHADWALVSVKADLFAYSAADWQTYLGMYGQLIAAGGFFLFVLVISWVFGREFSDKTIKDLLAVPTLGSLSCWRNSAW